MFGKNKLTFIAAIVIVFTFVVSGFIQCASAESVSSVKGFNTGPSFTNVVPLKKTTFVRYDDTSILDDYDYLAALPTTVFYDKNSKTIYSYPLLFYQDEYKGNDQKELTLNARSGIDYFMDDWMAYTGQLDQMTLINVSKSDLNTSWKANDYTTINTDNPYDVANQLALRDWSYSDNAVVAVIGSNFEKPNNKLTKTVNGTLPASNVYNVPTFKLKQTNSLNPVFTEFNVPEGYKYLEGQVTWDLLILAGHAMLPTGDPDFQLYCKEGGDWMQTTASSEWNILGTLYLGHEYAFSRIYNSGPWRMGITDIPTKGDSDVSGDASSDVRHGGPLGLIQVQGSLLKALKGLFTHKVTYYADVTLYPGVDIKLPDNPPYGCSNPHFKLKWDDPNVNLGFSVIGPGGEVIYTEINESRTDSQEIQFDKLGQCLDGENYTISVFSLGDVTSNVNFEIEYSWEQNMSKSKGDALTSATEGSILASMLNAPLLYTSTSELSQKTTDVLYKLGVENIYLVDLGTNLKTSVKDDIKNIANIKEYYQEPKQIYDAIREITNSNDVIFSTVQPWTYWYLALLNADFGPDGQTEGGLFIGPAAYIAAQHGAPVIIVDNHPELSSAVVWPTDFWERYSGKRIDYLPSVSEMVLVGRRVYKFLGEYGFDKIGKETIITVADQYDIGVPWDRIFPGAANPGRFCGTPVDTSYWICRSVFYPALIFENPALQGEVTLINGSMSSRGGAIGLLRNPFLNTLVINRKSGEEKYKFPILCSLVGYDYRFNERASKYYGMQYQCADGLIPGVSSTMDAIDEGMIKKYTGKDGSYFPDMSAPDVIPMYLERGGYSTAFSTQLEAVTNDLNQGVILWIHDSHGVEKGSGSTLFFDPATGFKKAPLPVKILNRFVGTKNEENPWIGYEWEFGSTQEPDTMSMDIKGYVPFTSHKSLIIPATGYDWVLAYKPFRDRINQILDKIKIIPFRFNTDKLYDGVVATLTYSRYQTAMKNSLQIEPLLKNLHSAGFITGICQTSNTYLHMSLVRHGSVFQVQDPWPTSWYGDVWRESIPRDIILGYTVGQAYTRGISHVGILYLDGGVNGGPQWWWDPCENVVYFGDPNLRMYVPNTDYSSANHWEQKDTMPLSYGADVSIDGHMPFGATSYPHEKQPATFWQQYMLLIVALLIIVIIVLAAVYMQRRKKAVGHEYPAHEKGKLK